MDFYRDLLIKALENEKIEVTFPDLKLNPAELVELRSLAALRKIKAVVDDDTLDDPECFERIDEIIHTLEFLGIDSGTRHDFG